MKFQQIAALEKHIDSSYSSKGFIRSYLILHSQREERKRLLEKIAKQISAHVKGQVFFHEAEEWDSIYHSLSAPSLFGDPEILIWDGFKTLSEEWGEKLSKYLIQPSPWAFLLIGADSFKPFSSVYSKASKELAVLDLSEEKPWDREKRQQQEMLQKVQKEGKSITPAALVKLLSLCEDSLTLESELAKVLCYIGDRSSIIEKDVEAITSSFFVTRWQIAEELIWEKGKDHEIQDLSAFLALLGQLRFLLSQARQIVFYLQERKSLEEIMKGMNIKSIPLQKVLLRMKSYDPQYFESGLSAICDIEILTKNSSLDSGFLFHYLCIKFTQLKKKYAR